MNYVYEFRKNLYVNLTNKCVCSCIFCDKDVLQDTVKASLRLSREPTAGEVIAEMAKIKKHYSELVFCGIGDPLVRLDTILEILRDKPIKLKTRMNTTGHAHSLYPDRNVAMELRNAGLDAVNISLNATDKESYKKVCRPAFKDSFDNVIRFAEECRDAGMETILSFVDGYADPEDAKALCAKLGVKIRIREKI